MKKSEAKTNIFGRGLAAKHSTSSTQPSNGISIYMYLKSSDGEQTLIVNEFGRTYDAEELCYMAVEKLGISPLVAPLFALAYPLLESWCPPNEKILCSAECAHEFILRIRFIPPETVISKLSRDERITFNYLFQQIRDDFINDYIVFTKSIGQEHLLGLGVIDMVRYGKEQGINLSGLRNLEPQDFIPASAKNKFKFFFDKKRLHMNFKPHLQKEYEQYENDTVVNIQLTYIKSIAVYSEQRYGVETFRITPETLVEVTPFDTKFPGLNIREGKVMQSGCHFTCVAYLLCVQYY